VLAEGYFTAVASCSPSWKTGTRSFNAWLHLSPIVSGCCWSHSLCACRTLSQRQCSSAKQRVAAAWQCSRAVALATACVVVAFSSCSSAVERVKGLLFPMHCAGPAIANSGHSSSCFGGCLRSDPFKYYKLGLKLHKHNSFIYMLMLALTCHASDFIPVALVLAW
jgi:hypothetical protein